MKNLGIYGIYLYNNYLFAYLPRRLGIYLDPLNGEWWPPTIEDEVLLTAWITWYLGIYHPMKTNMASWKIHHEWRCMDPVENGNVPIPMSYWFSGGVLCVCGPLSVTVVGLTVIGMPDPDNVT